MRVVVAMDSFKGCMTAAEACAAVSAGLGARLHGAEIVLCPMADGGEGTTETLLAATGGAWIPVRVTGPLPDAVVDAGYAWLPGAVPGALVEMAKASGLELVPPGRLDPLTASTRGTGELLAAALGRGAERVWLAIGGSATVDGGVGAARPLGWRFLDADGAEVGPGGGGLALIERIVAPESHPWASARVEVLCDVDNPLLGERGAARVFGPQKGATREMVEQLDAGLGNLADLIERDLGKDVRNLPGSGAAGGLGAGSVAFLDARLVSGVEAVMDAAGLTEALVDADWVVTGEGRLDRQSLSGKVVSGVAARAARAGCRVAVVAGSVALDPATAHDAGISAVQAATPPELPLGEALARGAELVEEAAGRLSSVLGGLRP